MFIKGLLLALLTLALDQWSKWYVFSWLAGRNSIVEVSSFFNLVMVENKGISFGLFNNHPYSYLIFAFTSSVVTILLLFWLKKAKTKLLAIGLGLVIGGAVGNVIDRIRFGAVADFLDFHLAGYHWPAFNLADAGVCVGAAFLCIDAFLNPEHKPQRDIHGRA